MNIEILAHTPQPVEVIYRAYKQCYAAGKAEDIKIPTYKKMEEFICKWMSKEHESPLEQVYFTFSITGTSRVNQQQLTRHRHASFNIQSQRYVNAENFDFVIPSFDYIKDDTKRYVANSYLSAIFKTCLADYQTLIKLGVKKEDARCILPNATTSNIVVTMNLRSLRHFYEERSCKHAQSEIRDLANKMMDLVKEIIPFADYKAKKCGIICFECVK